MKQANSQRIGHVRPMVRSIATALVFFWSGFLAVANEPLVLTLDDCIAIGRERSLALSSARLDLANAEQTVRQVRAQIYPALDLAASYTRLDEGTAISIPGFPATSSGEDAYSASATVDQLLYAGGSVRAALRVATNFLAAAVYDLEHIEAAFIRDVTQSFYELLVLETEVDVARESVKQLSAFARQAQEKMQAGRISEFEALSAQVSLANERPRRVAAENRLALARRSFRNLIHIDDEAFVLKGELEVEPERLTLDDLLPRGLAQRPELLAADTAVRIASDDQSITRGDALPELRAFASYYGNDPSERDFLADGWDWGWMAGLRATWNLWDGGARRAEGRIKANQTVQAMLARDDLERAVLLEIESAWRGVEQSVETLHGTRDAVTLAERANTIAGTRFEQGLSTHLEFMDSHIALREARLNHGRALASYHQTLAEVAYATGDTAIYLRQERKP